MSRNRDPRANAKPTPKAKPDADGRPAAAPSRSGLLKFGARAMLACSVIAGLTVVANWHAAGLVRRGEIDRMLRKGSSTAPQAAVEKPRGTLDRGRLNALFATASR